MKDIKDELDVSRGAAWHQLSAQETAEILDVKLNEGLSLEDVIKRRGQYGFNRLTPQKRLSAIFRFLQQFHQPLLSFESKLEIQKA